MLNINQIYNEDCLSGMKKLPDGSIDFIFSDLPYGITNNSCNKRLQSNLQFFLSEKQIMIACFSILLLTDKIMKVRRNRL